jgi:hypothetical protein
MEFGLSGENDEHPYTNPNALNLQENALNLQAENIWCGENYG